MSSFARYIDVDYGILPGTGTRPRSQAGTLGNMRANGVRSLAVSCHLCHHAAVLSADSWPDQVPVPTFGPRMVCTRCGIIGADARPNWRGQPTRESWHTMRRSGQQCGSRSDRRTGKPLARSRGPEGA
jgi:hypothetical protein